MKIGKKDRLYKREGIVQQEVDTYPDFKIGEHAYSIERHFKTKGREQPTEYEYFKSEAERDKKFAEYLKSQQDNYIRWHGKTKIIDHYGQKCTYQAFHKQILQFIQREPDLKITIDRENEVFHFSKGNFKASMSFRGTTGKYLDELMKAYQNSLL